VTEAGQRPRTYRLRPRRGSLGSTRSDTPSGHIFCKLYSTDAVGPTGRPYMNFGQRLVRLEFSRGGDAAVWLREDRHAEQRCSAPFEPVGMITITFVALAWLWISAIYADISTRQSCRGRASCSVAYTSSVGYRLQLYFL
jgi:hypothetical protein